MVVYTVIAFAWSVVTLSELEMVGQGFQLPFLIGAGFAAALAVSSILYSARLDTFTLYRWMLPVLVVSLTLLVYETTIARTLSYILITVAQVGFDIMIWLYFTSISRRGYRSAAITLGMSRGFAQVGVTVGSLLGPYLVQRAAAGDATPAGISLVMICVLVIVIGFVLNRQAWFEKVIRDEPGLPQSRDERTDEEPPFQRIAARYGLSPREREVLVFLAHGRSLPYIREQLVFSKNTVDTHAKNLYRKLDVHSRQELIDLIDKGLGSDRS